LRQELTGLIEHRNTYNHLQHVSALDQKTLTAIIKDMKMAVYEPGHEIIRQGDVGESFYMLLSGKVDILVRDENGEEVRVNQLGRGQYFGEMALMGSKRRNATVRVSRGGPAKVIELGVPEFERLSSDSERFKTDLRKVSGIRRQELEKSRGKARK
jgi:CRP-like cAMP-binding protein